MSDAQGTIIAKDLRYLDRFAGSFGDVFEARVVWQQGDEVIVYAVKETDNNRKKHVHNLDPETELTYFGKAPLKTSRCELGGFDG